MSATRASVLRRLFAAFLLEASAMTRPDLIAGVAFGLAAFLFQFVTGGITWSNYASWLLPSVWTTLALMAWLVIQAARHVLREDIDEWKNWKPLLVGSSPPSKPSRARLLLTTVTLLALLLGAIILTMVFAPASPSPIIRASFAPQTVSAVADGIFCEACVDELGLDGDGFLYITQIGRGFIEVGLSEVPTVELNDPEPGDIPLPQPFETVARGPTNTDAVSLMTDTPGAEISLRGTYVNGKLTITHVVIPEGFRGTLKIRERLGLYRFEVGGRRQRQISVASRNFTVTLATTKETPGAGGKRTVFSYTFHVKEP